jgi:hypothetical protein
MHHSTAGVRASTASNSDDCPTWQPDHSAGSEVPASQPVPATQPSTRQEKGPPQGAFLTDVPSHPLDVILARPTDRSVTISVMAAGDARTYVAWGTDSSRLTSRTEPVDLKGGAPREIILGGLKADTRMVRPSGPGGIASTFQTHRVTPRMSFDTIADEQYRCPGRCQVTINVCSAA